MNPDNFPFWIPGSPQCTSNSSMLCVFVCIGTAWMDSGVISVLVEGCEEFLSVLL